MIAFARTGVVLLCVCVGLLYFASEASALRLSAETLPITNHEVVPPTGTLTLVGIFDELPPGSVAVSGGPFSGGPVLIVRGTLTGGEVFSLGGVLSDQSGGMFCCVGGTGYTPASERIPGPDAVGPNIWEWFFDDIADPGFWVAGETVEFWVSFTQLEPGDQIEFFVVGTSGLPCPPEGCTFLGTVTVLPDAVPLNPQLALVAAALLALAFRQRLSRAAAGSFSGAS